MTVNGENLISIRCKVSEIMDELKNHEMELQKIQNLKDAGIYALDHIVTLRDAENERFYNVDASLRSELRGRVDALFDSLERKADINSPAFQNAFNMINVLGEQMDAKTLNDIISDFRGQMGELHLLRKACIGSNVGNCSAVFDDYIITDDYKETLKRQVDNLLVFSHSFGIVSDILGESVKIDAETVSADAGRAFGNNKAVL